MDRAANDIVSPQAQATADALAMRKHRATLRRAYFLWEKAGRPWGNDQAFWDEAHQQIDQEGDAALEDIEQLN